MRVEKIPVDIIDPPAQANRMGFDDAEIQALAASIRDIGLINPITVKPIGNGRYEVVAGHRRWFAVQMNDGAVIDAVVQTDSKLGNITVKFAENNIRSDLTPVEEAIALNEMLAEQGEGTLKLAARVARTQSWVEARLELLSYPEDIQEALQNRTINLATAHQLNYVTDTPHRKYLMQYAVESGASAAVMHRWRQAWQASQTDAPGEPPPRPEMGELGQPPEILIPCAICTKATDHMRTKIVRCCEACYFELMDQLRGKPA